jgi:hypothetical protein
VGEYRREVVLQRRWARDQRVVDARAAQGATQLRSRRRGARERERGVDRDEEPRRHLALLAERRVGDGVRGARDLAFESDETGVATPGGGDHGEGALDVVVEVVDEDAIGLGRGAARYAQRRRQQ